MTNFHYLLMLQMFTTFQNSSDLTILSKIYPKTEMGANHFFQTKKSRIIGGQNFKIPAIVSTQCKQSTKTFTALHSHLHFYAATEFAMKPLNIPNKMIFIIRTFLCQLFGFYFSGTVTIKSSFVIWCKFCKSSKSSRRFMHRNWPGKH